MLEKDYLFINSDNVWFGIPSGIIESVRMNQKPGWFPQPEQNSAGIFLHDSRLYHIIHLNAALLGNFRPFPRVHLAILKPEFGFWAIAGQEVKTRIDLPRGAVENIKELAADDYGHLLTHWFPVDLKDINLSVAMDRKE
jgi:hypothetical protein